MSANGLQKFHNDHLLICPDSGERICLIVLVLSTLLAITNKSLHKKNISFDGTPLHQKLHFTEIDMVKPTNIHLESQEHLINK